MVRDLVLHNSTHAKGEALWDQWAALIHQAANAGQQDQGITCTYVFKQYAMCIASDSRRSDWLIEDPVEFVEPNSPANYWANY